MSALTVSPDTRAAIVELPAILARLERSLSAWKQAYEKALKAADGDGIERDLDAHEVFCDELLEQSGEKDLSRMLDIIAGRICWEIGIGDLADYEKQPSRDQAVRELAEIAGRYQ